ncbi:MAG: hypothetical protein M5U28_48565 [Sandaracinaceae bacterium]|nr:hypothetical protein [Sandaracinaceae bacterium]
MLAFTYPAIQGDSPVRSSAHTQGALKNAGGGQREDHAYEEPPPLEQHDEELAEGQGHADVLEHVDLRELAELLGLEREEVPERERREVQRVADGEEPRVALEALEGAGPARGVLVPRAKRRVPERQPRAEEEHRRGVAVHEGVVRIPALALRRLVEERREDVPLHHQADGGEPEEIERQPARRPSGRQGLGALAGEQARRGGHRGREFLSCCGSVKPAIPLI